MKPLQQFDSKGRTASGKQLKRSHCRTCHNGNPKAKAAATNRVNKCKAIVKEILTSTSCKDCGHKDWRVLQFDHKDPTQKSNDISIAMSKGRVKSLLEEIKNVKWSVLIVTRYELLINSALGVYYKFTSTIPYGIVR